jgi:hypothetical protein
MIVEQHTLYALQKANAEAKLDELDPDWREHFAGDWQRAQEYYRPRGPGRMVNCSPFSPPEFVNDPEEREE